MKVALMVCGVVGVLVGLAFIMPAIAQLRDKGVLPAVGVALLFLGVTLSAGGVWAVAASTLRRRA